MAEDLEFLGWILKPGVAEPNRQYYRPFKPGDWGDKALWIEDGQRLMIRGSGVSLSIRGLAVTIQTGVGGQPVALSGGSWRPTRSKDRLFIRMGAGAGPDGHRIHLGPVVLVQSSWPVAHEFGDKGVLRVAIPTTTTLVRDASAEVASPLILQGSGDNRLVINFAAGQMVLEAGALKASLIASKPTEAMLGASFLSQPVKDRTFAEIAQGKPLDLVFVAESADVGIPLNAAPNTSIGGAGMEVLDADLVLQLQKGVLESTPQVAVAKLKAGPGGKPMRLRMGGMWNSRNQAEVWSCPLELPLAFRMGWKSARPSPVVAASKLDGLERQEGFSAGKSKAILPIHGLIPGAQVKPLESPAKATLITSDAPNGAAEFDPKDLSTAGAEWRTDALRRYQTRPWLRFEDAEFLHPRPGEAYVGAEPLVFVKGAGAGGLPTLPAAAWAGVRAAIANKEVDDVFQRMTLKGLSATHETGLDDRSTAKPAIVTVMPAAKLLGPKGLTEQQTSTLKLESHSKALALPAPGKTGALLDLQIVTPEQPGGFEYAVSWPGNEQGNRGLAYIGGAGVWGDLLAGLIDPNVPVGVGKASGGRPTGLPLGILKLGRERPLEALMAEIGAKLGGDLAKADVRKRLTDLIGTTNPDILEADWVGLVALSLPLDFEHFAALRQTIPLGKGDAPWLDFMAVSPKPKTVSGAEVSVSGAVSWVSELEGPKPVPHPAYKVPEDEVSFWPCSLDIRFRDNRMTLFRSEATVELRSFMGVGNPVDVQQSNKRIRIIGSAQRKDAKSADSPFEFRFAAETTDPIRLYPLRPQQSSVEDESFLGGVWFRRLELVDAPGEKDTDPRKAQISIDGDLELKAPKIPDLKTVFLSKIAGRRIGFSKLGIDLLGDASLLPRILNLTYPSLKFDLDLPHVELYANALRMKLHSFAINWRDGFQFPGFVDLGLGNDWKGDQPNLFFLGRLDFGNLPSFFARSLSGFSLELGLGLNFSATGAHLTGGRTLVIRGFGFDGLNLDLLSFLKLSIDKLALGVYPPTAANAPDTAQGAHLAVTGVTLSIIGHTIFEKADGAFFSLKNGGGNGFWVSFPEGKKNPLLLFDWAFIGQNIDFDVEVAKALLTPPPTNEVSKDADEALGKGADLMSAWEKGAIRPATTAAGRGWTFAAGMTVFDGALKGRALIQDSGFAGLSLWGAKLKEWFGYDFSFCGIYRKDITPGEDYFYISTTLPGVTVGTIRFTGGVVAAEIYTSGSFLLDFGFPWQGPDGGRLWRRTIGAIVTPGQSSAGFYIRKQETSVVGGTQLTLSAGFALQWGLGAAFDGGIFKVWARLGVYAVMEGTAVLRIGNQGDMKLMRLTVAGAGGVLVEGEGSINWWVISVRVYVCASAEIRLLLDWQDQQQTKVQLTAELYVSAFAEACVGGGCFKICRGIRVGMNIPVTQTLTF